MTATPDPYESYLNQATLLFERGDIVKAGQIWQAILKKVPNHPDAKAGLYRVKLSFDSRATQDGPPVAAPVSPSMNVDPELGRILEQGCALYDDGKVEDAMVLWEKVLVKDPHNALAFGYLNGARRALGLPPLEPPAPVPEPDEVCLPEPPQEVIPPVASAPVAPAPEPDPEPEPAEAPSATPEPPPPARSLLSDSEVEAYMRDGCTLYDMGQIEEALQKWEGVLTSVPDHVLARQYANDARKELGLPPMSETDAPPTPPPPAAPAKEVPAALKDASQTERADFLVRDGIQLFDMGMTLEAIRKWEQALSACPDHKDAKEYLEMAKKEADKVPSKELEAPKAGPTPTGVAAVDSQIHQAEQLLNQSRFQEAQFLFEQVLKRSPDHPRALRGHQLANQAMAGTLPPPEPEATPQRTEALVIQMDHAVSLPQAAAVPPPMVAAPAPAKRQGPSLPPALKNVQLPSWLMNPMTLLLVGFGILLLWTVFYLVGLMGQKQKLIKQVGEIREATLARVAQQTTIPSLAEEIPAIRAEVDNCMQEDPFRAYCRAQQLMRANPLDAATAQLLDKATRALARPTVPLQGDIRQADKLLQDGEIEGAERIFYALLCTDPDSAALRTRYTRVCLALAQIYALKERWGDSRTMLLRGRALNEHDTTWQMRMKLLDQIQTMSPAERKSWIALLG